MKKRVKIEVIPNWREAWKFFSVQLATAMIFIEILQDNLPGLQPYLPEGWVKWISLAIIVGRLLHQNVKAVNEVNKNDPKS